MKSNKAYFSVIQIVFLICIYFFLSHLFPHNAYTQDSTVIKELENAYDIDQKIRDEWYISEYRNGIHAPKTDSLGWLMQKVDSLNQILLKDIFDKYGFLGRSKVGDKAVHAQWLIVHHSIDSVLCDKYLEIFRVEIEKGEIEKWAFAYLDDRIRVRKGLPQLYGTQQIWNKELNRYVVAPIEDPEHLHERRIEMGLETDSVKPESDSDNAQKK